MVTASQSHLRWIGALVALVVPALCVPGEALAGTSNALQITPTKPLGSKAITVKWRTDRAPRPGREYRVALKITGQEGQSCRRAAESKPLASWRKGATVTTVLRSRSGVNGRGWWCSGIASVRILAAANAHTTVVAQMYFEIASDPRRPTPGTPIGTQVKLDLLDGSSMTVRVPGRADRSGPLTGRLTGVLPGKFKPNTDIQFTLETGSLSLGSLPADPACTTVAHPFPVGLRITKPSTMTLLVSGRGSALLNFAEDPLSLIGCQGPAPVAPRPFALVGQVGPTGLVSFTMTGSLGGVRLNEGVDATIDVTLVVKIDLSGK